MPYDIVIATRNRPSALAMSLPLILRQTVPANKLIIVDASDDPLPTQAAIEKVSGGTRVFFELIHTTPSSARQRNIGLERVTAPIVMMPDDDSLWYPDTAEEIMKVYALDTAGAVGGVTGAPVGVSPLSDQDDAYPKNRQRVWKSALQPLRNRIEDVLVEPPFRRFARDTWRNAAVPRWIDGENSKLVEFMTGFRMSFRTDAVKAGPFDELLGYRNGYAQFEDTELSLRLQKGGKLLVSAEKAKVFHHVFPSKRAKGFEYGFGQVANYAYVCRKLMAEDSAAWSVLERHLLYKLFIYRLNTSAYGKEVYDGGLFAWKNRKKLMRATRDELGTAFMSLCDSLGSTKASSTGTGQ